jgi:enolase
VILENGGLGRAIAPAGASTGSGEAIDLRDREKALGGFGVNGAVANVNTQIASALGGMNACAQEAIDGRLIELDGTKNKSRLGGNAMIAVSMAVAHAAADGHGVPLWKYLGGSEQNPLPLPEIQIFGGGAHAEGKLDLQDFMVMPYGAATFSEAMEWTAEIYRAAGDLMERAGKRRGVADEGGYWPAFANNEEAIETLVGAIQLAGFSIANEVGISLDIAASQFYSNGGYQLKAEDRWLNPVQWHDVLVQWVRDYPIVAIEDPFVESDFDAHAGFLEAIGSGVQLVGDDLLVTNTDTIAVAKDKGACNTLLCKPNQAGTLTEAKAAFHAAREAGWGTIVSARSGETEDVTIVHLALGWGIQQLKVGSFARSERMAKWNEAIRLEEHFGSSAKYAGRAPLRIQG